MSWTLCTSGAAILKAGVNVNSNIVNYGTNKTFLDQLSDEAENDACTLARSNLIGNYSGLTANGKQVLAKFCEAHIAQDLINYDVDAIGRGAVFHMVNILQSQKREAADLISSDKHKTYLGIT